MYEKRFYPGKTDRVFKTIFCDEYDFNEKFLHIDLTYGMGKFKDEIYRYCVMDNSGNKYLKNFEIVEYNMDRINEYWYTLDIKKVSGI